MPRSLAAPCQSEFHLPGSTVHSDAQSPRPAPPQLRSSSASPLLQSLGHEHEAGGGGVGVGERERCAGFLEEYVAWVAPAEAARNQAWWDAALGDASASERLVHLDRAWAEHHADPAAFSRLRGWLDRS